MYNKYADRSRSVFCHSAYIFSSILEIWGGTLARLVFFFVYLQQNFE